MRNFVLDKNKVIQFSISFIGILLGVFLFFKSIRYVAPFLIAFILSIILEPFIKLLVNKFNIPRKLASILSVLLVLLTMSLVVSSIVSKLISEAKELFQVLPNILNDVYLSIVEFSTNNQIFPPGVTIFISEQLEVITSNLTDFTKDMVRYVFNTAVSIPSALIFFIITIISTYFFLGDKDKFIHIIKGQLPSYLYNKIIYIKTDIISSFLKLFRAYMMIMFVTFSELLLGFTIIGVNYALLLAAIIAILDILPILGTGGVLIPWAIYSLIVGDLRLGISLFILYIIILVVRQVLEPKIIGTQIGVHPLLTLASMYIGLKVFGATGLIFGPISFLIIRSIFTVVFKGQSLKELLFVDK
ncbi:sporulation integral membrane protein YtvI [Alkalibaculum sporogenes]|nr:sporulation integral membrane protein YtvI [Alkalibaculum sporogenes]